jgi:hypothetical protein
MWVQDVGHVPDIRDVFYSRPLLFSAKKNKFKGELSWKSGDPMNKRTHLSRRKLARQRFRGESSDVSEVGAVTFETGKR